MFGAADVGAVAAPSQSWKRNSRAIASSLRRSGEEVRSVVIGSLPSHAAWKSPGVRDELAHQAVLTIRDPGGEEHLMRTAWCHGGTRSPSAQSAPASTDREAEHWNRGGERRCIGQPEVVGEQTSTQMLGESDVQGIGS